MDTLLAILITGSEVFFYEKIRKEISSSGRCDCDAHDYSGIWICRDKDTGHCISGDVVCAQQQSVMAPTHSLPSEIVEIGEHYDGV